MKKNITILCLSSDFKKRVAKQLADELEMFYADVNDIMEYNLINNEMLEVAGQQYFDENEKKTLETVSSYDDTILTLNFSTLNKMDNFEIVKRNGLVIYVRLNFDDFCELNKIENAKSLVKLNELAFDDRDEYISKLADIIVEVDSLDITTINQNIIKGINEYFN